MKVSFQTSEGSNHRTAEILRTPFQIKLLPDMNVSLLMIQYKFPVHFEVWNSSIQEEVFFEELRSRASSRN